MNIGIIGTGRMGKALGTQWSAKGHRIFFGSRDATKAQTLAEAISADTQGGTVAQAAAFGDVVLLATVWIGVKDVLQAAADHLNGKTLIDCTLPLANRELAVDGHSSGAEEISKLVPAAKIVKGFCTLSHEHFAQPPFGAGNVSMFYCGNDTDSKAAVRQLALDVELDPVDCGPLFLARWIEGMGFIWIYLAAGQGLGDHIGFRLLR